MLKTLYAVCEFLGGEKKAKAVLPYRVTQRIKIWLLVNLN